MKVLFVFTLLLIACSSNGTDEENKTLVESYYTAYNDKDYAQLDILMDENIALLEMEYPVLKGKSNMIEIIQWGEALNSRNELKKIQVENGKVVALEDQISDRIQFLYGEPIQAQTTYTIVDNKITKIDSELLNFDQNRMNVKLQEFKEWVNQNSALNKDVIFQLNREGGEEFQKAIQLFHAQ